MKLHHNCMKEKNVDWIAVDPITGDGTIACKICGRIFEEVHK